jgi:hypothetical protein
MKKYTNHSGGCDGADMCWENEGLQYGVTSVAYSFYNHKQHSQNQHILNRKQLDEGWRNVMIAEKTLRRGLNTKQSFYVRNLVSRNWFQVKHADAIFAISAFVNEEHNEVKGGTGWAVQMAIDNNKPIFFFDQESNEWYEYSYSDEKFLVMEYLPTLTENFAGIGSRELTKIGKSAIKQLYEYNFK